MKIIEVNELKIETHQAPFYSIIDKTKIGQADPRACGCATLALLNMILILKERLNLHDERTAFDEMKWIQQQTQEADNTVQPEKMMEFVDKHPIFNSCRMLVMNPNGMDEEVFLRIFLRRLAESNLVLAMMEIPDKPGDPATNSLNHVSFVHSEDNEVYFDSLQVGLNFLLRAFYFSRPTTLIFFSVNPGEQDGR
ncbi:MAG: hypothetical protein K1X29_04930 [Bdellovibrionales bacterium]|nr:hypothetical protein [Bdellovibrionales bacterium]